MNDDNSQPLFSALPRGTLAEPVTEQLEKLIGAHRLQRVRRSLLKENSPNNSGSAGRTAVSFHIRK